MGTYKGKLVRFEELGLQKLLVALLAGRPLRVSCHNSRMEGQTAFRKEIRVGLYTKFIKNQGPSRRESGRLFFSPLGLTCTGL